MELRDLLLASLARGMQQRRTQLAPGVQLAAQRAEQEDLVEEIAQLARSLGPITPHTLMCEFGWTEDDDVHRFYGCLLQLVHDGRLAFRDGELVRGRYA